MKKLQRWRERKVSRKIHVWKLHCKDSCFFNLGKRQTTTQGRNLCLEEHLVWPYSRSSYLQWPYKHFSLLSSMLFSTLPLSNGCFEHVKICVLQYKNKLFWQVYDVRETHTWGKRIRKNKGRSNTKISTTILWGVQYCILWGGLRTGWASVEKEWA